MQSPEEAQRKDKWEGSCMVGVMGGTKAGFPEEGPRRV